MPEEINNEEIEEIEEEVGEDESFAEPEGPRFDPIEQFFYVTLSIVGDICDAIWITRFIFGPATTAWLYLKGIQSVNKNAIAQAVELIPVIGWLPISTIAAILTIWSTNNPKSFENTFGFAAKAMDKIKIKK